MGKKDPRVDAYIDKSAEFARPILKHFRKIVHAACPEVGETIKWGMPYFEYKGLLCGMASFKEHCVLGFWKGELLFGGAARRDAMGHFGRITSVKDLPPEKTIAGYVRKAMKLNEDGVKAPRMENRRGRPPLPIPPDLRAALATNEQARTTFESFSPSHRREYVEWITEAKTDATRARRLATAVEWLAAGRPRHWQYSRSGRGARAEAPPQG